MHQLTDLIVAVAHLHSSEEFHSERLYFFPGLVLLVQGFLDDALIPTALRQMALLHPAGLLDLPDGVFEVSLDPGQCELLFDLRPRFLVKISDIKSSL
jgi:hypothetical protein